MVSYPRTVDSIDTEIDSLGSLAGVTVVECAEPTVPSGRKVRYLHVAAGPGPDRIPVGIVAGIHAREWAPPDALLTFVRKLLTQYKARRGIRYDAYTHPGPPAMRFAPFVISWPQVKRIVEKLDLFVLPCANPEGRGHSQSGPTVDDDKPLWWRKNRRQTGATTYGVDINRNFDIAWDYQKYYDAKFESSGGLSASKDPADYQTYIGDKAESEAETRNLKAFILDNKLKYFIDIHACGHTIGWPWAMETNGSDPAQSWQNAAFDRVPATSLGVGGRDGDGASYSEFFPNDQPTRLQARHRVLARAARDRIRASAGADATAARQATYGAQQLPDGVRYYSTGTSVDFAFSQQLLKPPPVPLVYSLVIESGSRDIAIDGGFKPTAKQFPKIEREIHAALGEILNHAAMWG